MVKYDRRYVPKCAQLCGRLNSLTSDFGPREFDHRCKAAWEMLKYHVAHTKGVWHINYDLPIYVATDGSKGGVGGYVYQLVDGEERVISYYSRKCTVDERKYDTRQLELLAVLSTLENFHVLIDGHAFTLKTDHKNLRWLMQQPNLDGTRLGRWVIKLQKYNMKLEYQKGETMHVADCMSRNSVEIGVVQLGDGHFELVTDDTVTPSSDGAQLCTIERAKPGAAVRAMAPIDPKSIREVGAALAPHKVTLDDIKRETATDEYALQCQSTTDPRNKDLFMAEGIMYRPDPHALGAGGGEAGLRMYLPKALRDEVMHNFHSSIYGTHRNWTSTYADIANRFWWPQMSMDVRNYVKHCRECQLAKGGEPRRQGLLSGRRHSSCMYQLCLDLIGPIMEGVRNASGAGEYTYILTVGDPFSHMLWLSLLTSKNSAEVVKAMVDRILLEEGAPNVILTDYGSEFANQVFDDFCSYMQTEHFVIPVRHPQSNQAERFNRFIGEQLRAMCAAPGFKKREWGTLIKYIEFSYRRTVIPGTNVTPFLVARGRQPLVPGDPELEERELCPPSLPLEEQVAHIQRHMKEAQKLVHEAREKVMARNKEAWDEKHFDVSFEPGEIVRLFADVTAIKDQSTGLMHSTKLKLRNSLYRVVTRHGNVYELISVDTGTPARASVDQLGRYYAPAQRQLAADKVAKPAVAEVAIEPEDLFAAVKAGKYIVYHDTSLATGTVLVAEVLEKHEDGKLELWYLWDGGQAEGIKRGRRYNPRRPLGEWLSEPEWFDPLTGKAVSKPTTDEKKKLEKRTAELCKDDYEIIVPAFDGTRTYKGEFLPALTNKVDNWLRKQKMPKKMRCKQLSNPTADDRPDANVMQMMAMTRYGVGPSRVASGGAVDTQDKPAAAASGEDRLGAEASALTRAAGAHSRA